MFCGRKLTMGENGKTDIVNSLATVKRIQQFNKIDKDGLIMPSGEIICLCTSFNGASSIHKRVCELGLSGLKKTSII